MKYLLDTCVLSDFARGEANSLKHIKATLPEFVALSVIGGLRTENWRNA